MTDERGTGARVMPRRAAAKKATQLSAEQLLSSPEGPANRGRTFGEPSSPRSPVKVTYGGKGKKRHLAKASGFSASPPQARVRKAATAQSRTRPLPVTSSVVGTFPPPSQLTSLSDSENETDHPSPLLGKTSRSITSPFEHGSSLTPLSDTESDSNIMITSRPPSRQPRAKRSVLHAEKPSKQPRPLKARDTRNGRTMQETVGQKRALSPTSSEGSQSKLDDDSTLTPLSSPAPTDLPARRRSSSPFRRRSKTLLGPAHSEGFLDTLPFIPSQTSGRAIMPTTDVWNLESLGTQVWVRIDSQGGVVDDRMSEEQDTFWWPAKVIHRRDSTRVNLFGDALGHSDTDDVRELTIDAPSASNILSMAVGGTMRFNEANFRQPQLSADIQRSPRKKRKSDIETRWKAARDLMLAADQEENDGLPMWLSTYVAGDTLPPLTNSSRNKGKQAAGASDDTGKPERRWRAPSCDPTYELPGELVLAKEKRSHTQYWPARLLRYLKPENPRQKPKYEVEFYNGEIKNLEPNLFYTTVDKGFKTCQLGQDIYNYGLNDEADEADDSVSHDAVRPATDESAFDEATLRIPSPVPRLAAPRTFVDKLSLAEQFSYVKPILASVIEGDFKPANQRHTDFMRGAAARRKVCESGYSRGSLRSHEVEDLLDLIMQWARRRQKRKELGITVGPGATSPSERAEPSSNVQDQVMAVDSTDQSPPPPSQDAQPKTMSTAARVDTEAPTSSIETSDRETKAAQDLSDNAAASQVPDEDVVAERVNDIEAHDMQQDIDMADSPLTSNDEVPPVGSSETTRSRATFADLSEVDKITYCQNILLNEAVLQLLLWRCGQRMSLELLPPDEEQRLRNIAVGEAEKTYWVHDIVRMKQHAASKDRKAAQSPVSLAKGGTRLRPRRR